MFVRRRRLEIWNLEIGESGNLEIWDLEIWEFGDLGPGNQEIWVQKIKKMKILKIQIRSAQNVGKVWISRKEILPALFGAI